MDEYSFFKNCLEKWIKQNIESYRDALESSETNPNELRGSLATLRSVLVEMKELEEKIKKLRKE